ncbi:MAG: choice-of-anchor tandem repeat GloVer-containing protein [Alphaproteobacteria bacterium]
MSSDANAVATLKTLHSFCTEQFCPDGLNPANGLLRDAQGNLYGETTEGGAFGHGTVFQLYQPPGKTKYKIRVLHDFCFDAGSTCHAGETPGDGGHLIIDTQGSIYAAVSDNDGGLVLKLTPHNGGKRWSSRVLYDFCSMPDCVDGSEPAALTYAGAAGGAPYDGTSPLYGIAEFGGQNAMGTVFRLKPTSKGQWSARTLYSFCAQAGCADGSDPAHDLLLDASGNLYGVTGAGGGAGNPGVVFKLSASPNASWHQTVLHAFCAAPDCADGQSPSGGLVMDSAGTLLGLTAFGGNAGCRGNLGCGVVYKIAPDGVQTVVHAFCSLGNCADGELPTGRLTMDAAGNLFGTTFVGGAQQGGTVFQLTGGTHQVIFDFCSGACQGAASEPTEGVIFDDTGNLLGTAGGGKTNLGVAYRLTP